MAFSLHIQWVCLLKITLTTFRKLESYLVSTYLVPTKKTLLLGLESSGTISNTNYPLPSPKNQDNTVEIRLSIMVENSPFI